MHRTLCAVFLLLASGCASPADPDGATPAPESLPTVAVEYDCPEGFAPIYDQGVCGSILAGGVRGSTAQDIAASPIDPHTYVVPVYSLDPVQPTSIIDQGGVATHYGWLLVSVDGGQTWARREFPPNPFPLEERTALVDPISRDLEFAPDGTLHVLVSYSTQSDGSHVVHVQSDDLGATWRDVRDLGAQGDHRLFDMGIASKDAWVVFFSGPFEGLSYMGTHDGGVTWQGGVADVKGMVCAREPKASPVTRGVLTFCANDDGNLILRWSAEDGSVRRLGGVSGGLDGSSIRGSSLGTDGGLNATFVRAGEDPMVWLSRDGGNGWRKGIDIWESSGFAADYPEVDIYLAPHPAYDGFGNIHLVARVSVLRTAGPLALEANFHFVIDPATRNVTATQLEPWRDLTRPYYPDRYTSLGTFGPTEQVAFQGMRGLAVLPTSDGSAVAPFVVLAA